MPCGAGPAMPRNVSDNELAQAIATAFLDLVAMVAANDRELARAALEQTARHLDALSTYRLPDDADRAALLALFDRARQVADRS